MIEWLLVFLLILFVREYTDIAPFSEAQCPTDSRFLFLFFSSSQVAIIFRKRITSVLSEKLGYRPVPLTGDGFEQDIEDGLTSSTFDVTQNLMDGDTRSGLDSEEI